MIIFRFPGLSPHPWTQGTGRSPRADTDISTGHDFIHTMDLRVVAMGQSQVSYVLFHLYIYFLFC